LDRPALLQALDQGSHKRLTLLTAPAGSGKSTLIRQWLATDPDRPTALLALQDLDRDPARFFARLAQAIRAKAPGFDSSAFTPFDTGNHCNPSTIAEALVHSLAFIDHPVTLILDDFQHLSHTPVITTHSTGCSTTHPHAFTLSSPVGPGPL